MMYLLIDGDYLLSGVKPTSDTEIKEAMDRMQTAIEEQLLLPKGFTAQQQQQQSGSFSPPPYMAQIELRVVLFSSALAHSLTEKERDCVVSTLRRLRYQTSILDSVRGRAGSPVDAALCTKAISFAMMPHRNGGGVAMDGAVAASTGGAGKQQIFCFVTPNAYIASALDLVTARGCDVLFAIYEGDEVAEELLGYVSAAYGSGSGIATMPKKQGVSFIPNTEAASAALAALQQEGKDLPLGVLMQLKHMQDSLTKRRPSAACGGSGDSQATIISESNRKRKEEQELFHPPPPLPSGPNPFTLDEEGNIEVDKVKAPAKQLQLEGSGAGAVVLELFSDSGKPAAAAAAAAELPQYFLGGTEVVTTETSPAQVVLLAHEPAGEPPALSVTSSAMDPSRPSRRRPSGEEPRVATVLPKGWALVYSRRHQRHYFAYVDSQGNLRSMWEHPLGAENQRELQRQVDLWYEQRDQSHASPPAPPAAALTADTVSVTRPTDDSGSRKNSSNAPAPAFSLSTPLPTGGALPEGWEEQVDPATGRKFYVNHITRQTTWQVPTASPQAPVTAGGGGGAAAAAAAGWSPASATAAATVGGGGGGGDDLPSGWETRADPRSSRTYYVNHQTKETTWVKPARLQPQPQPQQTSGQWVSRVDPQSGRTYYVNHVTKETTWKMPEGFSPVPTTAAAVVQQDEWKERVDPASGRTYYVNHRTKQTSWTRPDNGAASAPTTSSPQPAVVGWETKVDPKSGRTYYVNHQTKQTSWVRPS